MSTGPRSVAGAWLVVGIVAVTVASVPGVAPALFGAIATPPALVRAVLAGIAVVGGFALLARALAELGRARPSASDRGLSGHDLAVMVRGVRYVFLAAAAFAAAAGWILGEPLPIVVALVIAGVDLAETSFLLLVALGRR